MTESEGIEVAALIVRWKEAALRVLNSERLELYQALTAQFRQELHDAESTSAIHQAEQPEHPLKHPH